MKNINLLSSLDFVFKFSRSAVLGFPLFLAATSSTFSLNAETESFLPKEMIAGPGESKNNSLNTGSRASLTLGTSSSFGSSAQVSSTDAYKLDSVAAFVPLSGSWKSSFGTKSPSSPTDGGVIKANVGNIRSQGSGTIFDNLESTPQSVSSGESTSSDSTITPATSDNGYAVNAKDGTFAEGDASLEGVNTEIELVLDPDSTFTSTTITYLSDNKDANPMATANGGANLGLSNSLNVDLSNTSFQNAFSQAF